jgi:hemerythrin
VVGTATDRRVARRLPDRFFTFPKVWLTPHILGIDAKYSEHAHEQK